MTSEEKLSLFDDPKYLVAAVTWMTLGDGSITIPKKGVNGFFQVTHSELHSDYIEMKASILQNITSVKVGKYYHSGQDGYNWQLWTKCHPAYTKLRHSIYLDKRKVLSEHAIKLINPFCLAVLYQDDGRWNESKSTLSIVKPLFSELELLALAKAIVDKFGIIFRVRRGSRLKDGTIGYELGLRMKDVDTFFDLIGPYVVPSMSYKVRRGSSTTQSMMR